jgi:hypothetical protein
VKVLDKRKVSKQQHYWTLEQEGNSLIRILSETERKELKYPIEVFNVDGTPNKRGTITKYTWLDLMINGQT